MYLRAPRLASVIVAGLLMSACGATDRITAPTPTDSPDRAGSQSRDDPPPSPPQPLPPPVDRGPVPPAPPPSPPVSGNCDAKQAQWAIGEPASDDLLERARKAASAGSARFLRPNQPITMEFLGSRLNLDLDAHDVVRSARCG